MNLSFQQKTKSRFFKKGSSPFKFSRKKLYQQLLEDYPATIPPQLAQLIVTHIDKEIALQKRPVSQAVVDDMVSDKLTELGLIPSVASFLYQESEPEEGAIPQDVLEMVMAGSDDAVVDNQNLEAEKQDLLDSGLFVPQHSLPQQLVIKPYISSQSEILDSIKQVLSAVDLKTTVSLVLDQLNQPQSSIGVVDYLKALSRLFDQIHPTLKGKPCIQAYLSCNHAQVLGFLKFAREVKNHPFVFGLILNNGFVSAVEHDNSICLNDTQHTRLEARTLFKHIVTTSLTHPEFLFVFGDRAGKFLLNDTPSVCGSIDLKPMAKQNQIDWAAIKHAVQSSTGFFESQKKVTLKLHGWSDLTQKLKIPRASSEAFDLALQFGEFVKKQADKAAHYYNVGSVILELSDKSDPSDASDKSDVSDLTLQKAFEKHLDAVTIPIVVNANFKKVAQAILFASKKNVRSLKLGLQGRAKPTHQQDIDFKEIKQMILRLGQTNKVGSYFATSD